MSRTCWALIGAGILALTTHFPEDAVASIDASAKTDLSTMTYVSIYLSRGTHTLDVRNKSGGDPVPHLFRNGAQVAWDDDSNGNLQPRITYYVASSGYHYLVLRPYSSYSGGTASLYVDGRAWIVGVPFYGKVTLSSATVRGGIGDGFGQEERGRQVEPPRRI
jgi:hypothetical protein